MKLHPLIKEPELQFQTGRSICPRNGIAEHNVFDATRESRRSEILLGAVGTAEGIEKFGEWLERCRYFLDAEFNPDDKIFRPNLHYPFYGFNEDSGFQVKVVFGEDNQKRINPQDINALIKEPNPARRIDQAVSKYFKAAEFLDNNRSVDVIVCIIPDNLFASISRSIRPGSLVETDEEPPPFDELLNDDAEKADEYFDYLNRTGIPDYRAAAGNRGVYVLRRIENDKAHFLLLTLWESVEAIKNFAGEEIERARYYKEDENFLLDLEPFVQHNEVLAKP